MLRLRAISSQSPCGGPSVRMNSGVWRERVVKRLQKPSSDGVKTTLGG
jgi:hypothetical protein